MIRRLILCLALGAGLPAWAQQEEHSMPNMPGMSMPGMKMPGDQAASPEATSAAGELMNTASGTSVNPASWNMPMAMEKWGAWNAMFMGTAFVVDTQQSGPRGGDKLFSLNWFMGSFERKAGGKGALQFDVMLSLDPATITDERYPLLFQTGETAYGKALVDGQHPHNFVMALGVRYAYQLSSNAIVDIYFAPVGDPALGPTAYPHRASAAELPQAPISHHLQDSTHISSEVLTAGISFLKKLRWEASGFYGTEPGENRWSIEAGPINSWSTRLWYFPGKNWSAQVSMGRIAHPEVLEPGDQVRSTASIQYSKPVPGGSWSSSVIWGRTHNTSSFHNLNSYLAESVFPLTRKDFITGRVELTDKDELDILPGATFRIGAYTAGYTRDVNLFRWVETGVGANFTAYSLPDLIQPYYGQHPVGGNVFVRLRVRGRE